MMGNRSCRVAQGRERLNCDRLESLIYNLAVVLSPRYARVLGFFGPSLRSFALLVSCLNRH